MKLRQAVPYLVDAVNMLATSPIARKVERRARRELAFSTAMGLQLRQLSTPASRRLPIIDVGAHHGRFAAWAHLMFPEAQLIALEPSSVNYAKLVGALEDIEDARALRLAAGASHGAVELWLDSNSERHSLNDLGGAEDRSSESVELCRLDELLRSFGINELGMLKTDTEGNDLDVLAGAGSLVQDGRVRLIVSEVGFSKADRRHTYLGDLLDVLSEGYNFVGLYDSIVFGSGTDRRRIFGNALFASRRT
jgi:FkbM family methyltransferase